MCDPSRFPGLVTTRNVSTMSGILLLFQYMFLAFSIASGASRTLWGVHPPRDWAGVDFTRKRVKINVRFLKVLRGFIALGGVACDLSCRASCVLLWLVPRRGI